MRNKIVLLLIVLIYIISPASAVSNPVSYKGKTYYIVTSLDPTEDSGNEVCTKIGKVCVGYTEPSTAVCKKFHSNAAESSSLSGDKSGVYCNGSPQSGVCSTKYNTCHSCPACTVSVKCNQAIGGLYREMYVECANPGPNSACSISLTVRNTNDFFNQIASINAQLNGCPQQIPTGLGIVLANGNTLVNVQMNNGKTQSFIIIITNGRVTGVRKGSGQCSQTMTIKENDFNSILSSTNPGQTFTFLLGQGKITIGGCSFFSKLKFLVVNPITQLVAKFQTPKPPPPKPAPNCGRVGEQCNNRACYSGICAAPKENINGQWGFWNYRCITQSEWAGRCQGRGNTPAPWSCMTGPCR